MRLRFGLALGLAFLPAVAAAQVPGGPGACYEAGICQPLSPEQHNVSLVSSTALNVPAGATYAVVCAAVQNVRFTWDGSTTPTASVGFILPSGSCVSLGGAVIISQFRAIAAVAGGVIDVGYAK